MDGWRQCGNIGVGIVPALFFMCTALLVLQTWLQLPTLHLREARERIWTGARNSEKLINKLLEDTCNIQKWEKQLVKP